jgi:hypothetical protein
MARTRSLSGKIELTSTGGNFELSTLVVMAGFFGMESPILRSAFEIGLLKAMAKAIRTTVINGSVIACPQESPELRDEGREPNNA